MSVSVVVVLVDLLVSAQVRHNGEMTATAFDFTGVWLFAGVTINVRLKRAGSRKSLVADLAFVLLLSAGRDLGAE